MIVILLLSNSPVHALSRKVDRKFEAQFKSLACNEGSHPNPSSSIRGTSTSDGRSDCALPCQVDTAAKVRRDPNDPRQILEVTTARPVQSTTKAHYETFCECKDWGSKWKEDQDWCRIEDINERLYDKPYNFMTNGF